MELKTTKPQAIKAYKEADGAGKKLLINLFGAVIFSENITDRIKTFADVCDEAGVREADYELTSSMTHKQAADLYYKRLKLIAKVCNAGWVPVLADVYQNKYYPWFKIVPDDTKPSGFGLSYSGYGCDSSYSHLGARPYFKDKNTAAYVGTQFLTEYETWANYQQLADLQ